MIKITARINVFKTSTISVFEYISPLNTVVVPAVIASISISLCFLFLYGLKFICTLDVIVKIITDINILYNEGNVDNAANVTKIKTFLKEFTNSQ